MKFIITNIALLFFAITLQARTAATLPISSQPQVSMIPRYTGIGYNALYANPDGGGFYNPRPDPGVLLTRFIFRLTYINRNETSYRKTPILLPDQMEFFSISAHSTRETVDVFSGQTSYKKKLTESVTLSGM